MIRDINLVQLTGRLGADPEMRHTAQGSAITTFRVAANRTRRSADGSTLEDTEWFRVVAWARLAEICNEYLRKASRVYVEGRLRTHMWTDEQGGVHTSIEVIASEVILLDPPGARSGRIPRMAAATPSPSHDPLPAPDGVPAPPVVAPTPILAAPAERPTVAAGARVRGRGLRQRLTDIVDSAPAPEPSRARVMIEEQDLPL